MSIPRRLRRLPSRELPGGVLLMTAVTRRARLLGLMGLETLDPGQALLLPRCKSVHSFGMRFALDLIWLDVGGRVLRTDAAVAPGRLRICPRAHGVVEAPAGSGEHVAAALTAASGEDLLVVGLAGRRRPAGGLLDQGGAERRGAPELPELR